MPDLSGMSLAEASQLVSSAGLKVLSITDLSSGPARAPKNTPVIIVGQSPQPGSRVTAATTVTLQVVHFGG
jgi:beta-lactam-binding protein with PASTA domain